VVYRAISLLDYANMTHRDVSAVVHIVVEETLRGHTVCHSSEVVINGEGESEIGHLLLDYFAGVHEVAPIILVTGNWLVRVSFQDILFELLKVNLWKADERIAGIDQSMCIVPYDIRMEAGAVEFDFPGHIACCVHPHLLMTFLEQILVVVAEADH